MQKNHSEIFGRLGRYIILLTYLPKNVKSFPIDNLRFCSPICNAFNYKRKLFFATTSVFRMLVQIQPPREKHFSHAHTHTQTSTPLQYILRTDSMFTVQPVGHDQSPCNLHCEFRLVIHRYGSYFGDLYLISTVSHLSTSHHHTSSK